MTVADDLRVARAEFVKDRRLSVLSAIAGACVSNKDRRDAAYAAFRRAEVPMTFSRDDDVDQFDRAIEAASHV